MAKRVIVYLLAICLLLAGCAGQPADTGDIPWDTGEPMPGFDVQNQYMLADLANFQEADGFFCGTTYFDRFLRYYDKSSGVSGMLCSDPACSHDSQDCGAYVAAGTNLSYYNGQLYWIADDPQSGSSGDCFLWRGDFSGGGRVKIKRIGFQDVIVPYQPQKYMIHRGNLYILGHANVVDGMQISNRATLLSSPLDSSEEFTPLIDKSVDSNIHSTVRFVGDDLYFSAVTFAEGGPFHISIEKYHLPTGTAEKVYEETGIAESLGDVWVAPDGEIYLPGSDEKHAYLWKLEGGKRVEIAAWEGNDPTAPKIMDGIAVYIAQEDGGARWADVRSLSGETLYSGELFPEEIPGLDWSPNEHLFAVVGGDADKIIVDLFGGGNDGMQGYTLMLNLHDNLKPTILWGNP